MSFWWTFVVILLKKRYNPDPGQWRAGGSGLKAHLTLFSGFIAQSVCIRSERRGYSRSRRCVLKVLLDEHVLAQNNCVMTNICGQMNARKTTMGECCFLLCIIEDCVWWGVHFRYNLSFVTLSYLPNQYPCASPCLLCWVGLFVGKSRDVEHIYRDYEHHAA